MSRSWMSGICNSVVVTLPVTNRHAERDDYTKAVKRGWIMAAVNPEIVELHEDVSQSPYWNRDMAPVPAPALYDCGL